MRIKRLDIVGFKSFPERVQVPFAPGISAVVGPNGCGKSNIVDAIRWVMGEQSPKQLRGRNMEDILFNGARSHQPAGLSEVTLVLANERPIGPGPQLGPSEIAITRRLYRSGDSEYLINKVPCRLKDITQFFMDTGMGTKAYALIEQGRIGAVMDARPEDRRALIDEAAGITRYKVQKKEAERRIEATEQNFRHIETVLAETKRQIATLTRAANRAVRYKELKDELRAVDLGLTWEELGELDREDRDLTIRKTAFETELSGLLTSLEAGEVELEGLRLEIVDREKEAEAQGQAYYALKSEFANLKRERELLDRQIGENAGRRERLTGELARLAGQQDQQSRTLIRLENETAVLVEEESRRGRELQELRAAYATRKQEHDRAQEERSRLGTEQAQARNRLARLEQTLAGNEQQARRQAERREELGAQLAELESEARHLADQQRMLEREKEDLAVRLEEARARIAAQRAETATHRTRAEELLAQERRVEAGLAGLTARLATLKELKNAFGWYPEAVRTLMSAPELAGVGLIGPLAEQIVVPAGAEAAVEAALGERLGYLLVENIQAAARAIDHLSTRGLGRCGFLARDRLAVGARGDLLDALLGPRLLVDNLDQALAAEPTAAILTREGEYLGRDGVVIGGRGRGTEQGLLTRLKEVEELTGQVEELEDRKDELEDQRAAAMDRAGRSQQEVAVAEEGGRVAERALIEVDKKLSGLAGRRSDLEKRRSQLRRGLEGETLETDRLSMERDAARTEIESLTIDEEDLTSEIEQVSERQAALAEELESTRKQGEQAALEVNTLTQRLSAARREAEKDAKWLRDLEAQAEAGARELARTAEELTVLTARRAAGVEALAGFDDRLARAEAETLEAKAKVDQTRTEVNARETTVRQARRRREDLVAQVHKLEKDIQEVGFKRQTHLQRMETEYHLGPDEIAAAVTTARTQAGGTESAGDRDQARVRREDLRSKIVAMGEVNLTAIGEHEALQERYRFYREQYDDLTAAIGHLRESIAKINRTCRIRFNSTFKAVDEKLREIFPVLFEGGEAWLSLTDESDPLESGVEIHVHPPGKKLTAMSLLSGGEKALAALALIFALYLIKPSPFCLLDEIDAPLDEANIDRFNRLLTKLGQSSQIVMITHNKRTMQIARNLYGVTMETPGVSKMVSVNLSQLEKMEENVQLVQAG